MNGDVFGLADLPRCEFCGVAPIAGLWRARGSGQLMCNDCAIVVLGIDVPWRRQVV